MPIGVIRLVARGTKHEHYHGLIAQCNPDGTFGDEYLFFRIGRREVSVSEEGAFIFCGKHLSDAKPKVGTRVHFQRNNKGKFRTKLFAQQWGTIPQPPAKT